jgi:hypothetical protein
MKKLSDFVKLFKEPFVPTVLSRREAPPPTPRGNYFLDDVVPAVQTNPEQEGLQASNADQLEIGEPIVISSQANYNDGDPIAIPTHTYTYWTSGATGPSGINTTYSSGATGPIWTGYEYPSYKTSYPTEKKYKTKEKQMSFDGLSQENKVAYVKQEYNSLIKNIFEHPETLKQYILDKKLSNKQAKDIFSVLNGANISKCGCCRQFDPKLLKTPLNPELEPLIDLAQASARAKYY